MDGWKTTMDVSRREQGVSDVYAVRSLAACKVKVCECFIA